MPIDESKIHDTIISLNKKLREKKLEIGQISSQIEGLQSIMLVEQTREENGKRITEKVLPIDPGTIEPITNTRRQQIYDKIIAKSAPLLGN